MTTSKEVFALRKSGNLDQAYLMALELMSTGTSDEWDIKAFAWCLIDLIKRESKIKNSQNLDHYLQQLNDLVISETDTILCDQINYVKSLTDPNQKLYIQAKELSKQGRHLDAVNIYKQIFTASIADQNLHTSYGWELYKLSKSLWENNKSNSYTVKKYLNEYFKLNIEKPSLLNSCILTLAKQLAKEGELKIVPFLRLWGDSFQPDDYNVFKDNNNKVYPSLVESTWQLAGKEAIKLNNLELINYIIPYIEKAIKDFPDNIWFEYYLAKALLATGKNDHAKEFCINVCKAKPSDSWAWGLLADVFLMSDIDMAIACYCKAILCKNEETHKLRLRENLAKILIDRGQLSKAKFEIQQILNITDKPSYALKEMIENDWFNTIKMDESNKDFYIENAKKVDDIVYENLSWLDANLGEKFLIKEKNKYKYKILVKTSSDTIETSVPEQMIKALNYKVGPPIQVKGEFQEKDHFKIFLIKNRENGQDWDVLKNRLAVIDSVNFDKKLYHYIVDKNNDGVIRFEDFNLKLSEGDLVEIKTATYTSKSGTRLRVYDIQHSDKIPPKDILKTFENEYIEQIHGPVGFTESGFFIPPHLVKKYQIKEGDTISGQVILSFNNKRSEWGWKILKIIN